MQERVLAIIYSRRILCAVLEKAQKKSHATEQVRKAFMRLKVMGVIRFRFSIGGKEFNLLLKEYSVQEYYGVYIANIY